MFERIRTVLLLLPTIIELVKKMEELFPESGKGSMKLKLVIESLQQVSEISNDIIPYIESIISAVVKVFNQFGVFKK